MVGSGVGDVTLNLSQMGESVPIVEEKTIRKKFVMTDPTFEAILIETFDKDNRPSKDHYRCCAFQEIPEKYLFIEDEQ